jgi:hypothetical protein
MGSLSWWFVVPNMFVRSKLVRGSTYHYLVENVRVKGKVRQRVLAYLGAFDSLEDAWVNASGKRRARLARFRDPADVCNDQILWEQNRQYKYERRGWSAPTSAIYALLPKLPPLCDLPMRMPYRRWRRR